MPARSTGHREARVTLENDAGRRRYRSAHFPTHATAPGIMARFVGGRKDRSVPSLPRRGPEEHRGDKESEHRGTP